MRLLNRIIPWLAALAIFVLLEYLLKYPKQIYWLFFVFIFVIILSIWQLTGRQLKDKKFWQLIITPVLFISSGLIFFSFLGSSWFRQLFLIILAVSVWIFLEVILLRFNWRSKYQIHSLENISTHLDLFTVFLSSAGLFSLAIFLAVPLWWLLIIFCFIIALLNCRLIWAEGMALKNGWAYVIIITLATVEIFWAVSFLPTSIYVNGMVVVISYYLLAGLARNWLLGIRGRKVVKRYLLISFVALAIVLLTAKWF